MEIIAETIDGYIVFKVTLAEFEVLKQKMGSSITKESPINIAKDVIRKDWQTKKASRSRVLNGAMGSCIRGLPDTMSFSEFLAELDKPFIESVFYYIRGVGRVGTERIRDYYVKDSLKHF